MGVGVESDTEIYKNTYHELVLWIKELLAMRRDDKLVHDRNIRQAGRIMQLEFALRRRRVYDHIMLEDREGDVINEIGQEDNVVSLEEYKERGLSVIKGGRGTFNGDWLTPMPWGTQFYVRPKVQKTWMLAKFMKAGNAKRVIYVIPMRGTEDIVEDDREWMPVEAKAFCAYFELVEQFQENSND